MQVPFCEEKGVQLFRVSEVTSYKIHTLNAGGTPTLFTLEALFNKL
jgi:hypothetical protein